MNDEWTVDCRWKMQEIIPKLFVGPYTQAMNRDYLQSMGITLIIVLKSRDETYIKEFHPNSFKYNTVIMANSNTEMLNFNVTNALIHSELSAGGSIYCHCVGGISRAPTVVIAYLLSVGYTFQKALLLLQQQRLCINPIDSFIMQLKVVLLIGL